MNIKQNSSQKMISNTVPCSAVRFIQGIVINGLINVVISTLERRFDLPSTKTGLISSTYDISTAILVVFVSYYGEKRHKVRWLPIYTNKQKINFIKTTKQTKQNKQLNRRRDSQCPLIRCHSLSSMSFAKAIMTDRAGVWTPKPSMIWFKLFTVRPICKFWTIKKHSIHRG